MFYLALPRSGILASLFAALRLLFYFVAPESEALPTRLVARSRSSPCRFAALATKIALANPCRVIIGALPHFIAGGLRAGDGRAEIAPIRPWRSNLANEHNGDYRTWFFLPPGRHSRKTHMSTIIGIMSRLLDYCRDQGFSFCCLLRFRRRGGRRPARSRSGAGRRPERLDYWYA